MSIQYSIELAVFLFCAVVILSVIARKVAFPFPILLVLAGAGLGLAPGFPSISIDPDVIFLGCLPPLLFSAAIRMPWHQFRENLAPISGLALGLVQLLLKVVYRGPAKEGRRELRRLKDVTSDESDGGVGP